MQLLIEQIKSNDRKAQEILYKKYANRFFCICFRYLGNENDASEVLNNGFLKIFNNLFSFRFINNKAFEGWMSKIIINEALMFLRQAHNHLAMEEPRHTAINNFTFTEQHFSDDYCYALLQLLPLGYRTVFNLYAIEGYNHSEIAEMLHISESTSRSQLSRAREILKELIKKEL
jgi:RNA polymerase sigma factor (sigma-70 family)